MGKRSREKPRIVVIALIRLDDLVDTIDFKAKIVSAWIDAKSTEVKTEVAHRVRSPCWYRRNGYARTKKNILIVRQAK